MPSSANWVPRAVLKRSCGRHVWDYSSSDLTVFPGLLLPGWAMCVVYDEGMFKRNKRIVCVSRGAYPMTAVLQQASDALATTVATVSSGQMLGLNTSALLRDLSMTIPFATLRQVTEMLLAH